MAINDLWQVVAEGSYLGVNTNNVFWYQEVGQGAPNPDSLIATLFNAQVLPVIADIQHQSFTWTRTRVTNWTTGLEQAIVASAISGEVLNNTTDPMPSFVQYSFKLNRPSPIYSSGSKRFAGVPELFVAGNTELIPAQEVIDIENALVATLQQAGFQVEPRVLVTSLNETPQNTKMAEGPFTVWRPTSAIFRGVSTQRSRLVLSPL